MYIVFSLQLLGVESRHIHAYLPREVRLALSIAEATLLDLSAAFDSTCENSVHFDPRVGKIAISVYALLLTASLVALFYCCDSIQFVAKLCFHSWTLVEHILPTFLGRRSISKILQHLGGRSRHMLIQHLGGRPVHIQYSCRGSL